MQNATWLEERLTYLGGTDIAAIVGVNPYSSPFDVYAEKVLGHQEDEENAFMEWGKRLEAVIAEAYAEKTGYKLLPGAFIRNEEFPFLAGNPDRLIEGGGILDCKNAGIRMAEKFGEEGTNHMPAYYLVQLAWYCWLTGSDWAELAVLIGGNDFRRYTYLRDRSLEELLVDSGKDFWLDHVQPKIPPQIDGSKGATAFVKRTFPSDDGSLIQGTAQVAEWIASLRDVRLQIKEAEEVEAYYENQIKTFMGEASTLSSPDGSRITWKKAKDSVKVDYEAIVAEAGLPESLILKHSTRKEGSRRFLAKFAE